MAQRFGGKFSPQPGSDPKAASPAAFAGQRPTRAGGRVNLLFLAPLPFLVTAFMQGPVGLALDLSAFALLILAAWLTREGELAQEAYEARSVARRPAIPRKMFAGVLTALGVGVGVFTPAGGMVATVLLGLVAGALHVTAFGLDPLRDKGMEGIDRAQNERVARAVDEAEKHIGAMRDAVLRAGDREVAARIDRFASTARGLFRSVEGDPRDLTAARKYLSVYLQGARDATVRFADIYPRNRDPQVRADFLSLLDDLDTRFATRNDKTDLDIEIEVLRERLAYEAPQRP